MSRPNEDQLSPDEQLIVRWLEGAHRCSPWPGPDESAPHLRVQLLVNQIRAGEHRKWRPE